MNSSFSKIFSLTSIIALIAFASNSILAKLALSNNNIDVSGFTSIR